VILTDTGPLVALLDEADANHGVCVEIARHLPPEPLLTTWPCFTEAMYLLGAVGGHRFQAELWSLWSARRVVICELEPADIDSMISLMEEYRDTPMDLLMPRS